MAVNMSGTIFGMMRLIMRMGVVMYRVIVLMRMGVDYNPAGSLTEAAIFSLDPARTLAFRAFSVIFGFLIHGFLLVNSVIWPRNY